MSFSPTKRYVEDGYKFNETSEEWKEACRNLPCFSAIWWPNYSTEVVEETINGEPIVIQLWIGWCQKFLGRDDYPGGIGAEVGIYHRIPGKPPPSTIPHIPQKMADFILAGIAKVGGDDKLWWPYPELKTELEFEMVNPKTNETFFRAGPQTTYWLTKWMDTDSYDQYKENHGQTPFFSVNYNLKYKINGKEYEWT